MSTLPGENMPGDICEIRACGRCELQRYIVLEVRPDPAAGAATHVKASVPLTSSAIRWERQQAGAWSGFASPLVGRGVGPGFEMALIVPTPDSPSQRNGAYCVTCVVLCFRLKLFL